MHALHSGRSPGTEFDGDALQLTQGPAAQFRLLSRRPRDFVRHDAQDVEPRQRHRDHRERHHAAQVGGAQLPCHVLGDEIIALEQVSGGSAHVRDQALELALIHRFEVRYVAGVLQSEHDEGLAIREQPIGIEEIRPAERV